MAAGAISIALSGRKVPRLCSNEPNGGTTLRAGLCVTTERDFPSFYADCAIRPFIAERRGTYIRRESYKSNAAI